MSTLTWSDLYFVRHHLERSWDRDTSYHGLGDCASPVGQCYVSCLVARRVLAVHQPQLIRGTVNEAAADHYWLEIEGHIVDFTGDQFRFLPPVVWGSYAQFPAYVPMDYVTDLSMTDAARDRLRLLTARFEASVMGHRGGTKMEPFVIVNLCPHALDIRREDGTMAHYPPSGVVARCAEIRVPCAPVGCHKTSAARYGAVTNLPDPSEGVWYVVSYLTLQGLKGSRPDVLAPGPAIRDESGTIVGADGFSRWGEG